MISRANLAFVGAVVVACLAGLGFGHAWAAINCTGGSCTGNAQDNVMYGSPGYDYIQAGDGKDRIWGYGGNDELQGGAMADYMQGGDGNDTLRGQGGHDSATCDGYACGLNGGAGNDEINGFDGDDTITGGTGTDILNGDNGSDYVHGLDGEQDLVYGGPGEDVCTYDLNKDVIGGCFP